MFYEHNLSNKLLKMTISHHNICFITSIFNILYNLQYQLIFFLLVLRNQLLFLFIKLEIKNNAMITDLSH